MRVMSAKPRSVKFDPDVWEWAAVEAQHLGISTSQFIQSAVLARCTFSSMRRDEELHETFRRLYGSSDAMMAAKRLDKGLGLPTPDGAGPA